MQRPHKVNVHGTHLVPSWSLLCRCGWDSVPGFALASSHRLRACVQVSCGAPMAGVELAIADPETAARVVDGGVGEVWLRSPCVTAGYYGRPELSAAVFQVSFAGVLGFCKAKSLILSANPLICIGMAPLYFLPCQGYDARMQNKGSRGKIWSMQVMEYEILSRAPCMCRRGWRARASPQAAGCARATLASCGAASCTSPGASRTWSSSAGATSTPMTWRTACARPATHWCALMRLHCAANVSFADNGAMKGLKA